MFINANQLILKSINTEKSAFELKTNFTLSQENKLHQYLPLKLH